MQILPNFIFTGCIFDMQSLDIVLLPIGFGSREEKKKQNRPQSAHTRQCSFFLHWSKALTIQVWWFSCFCSLRACSHVRYVRRIAGFTLFCMCVCVCANASRSRLMYDWRHMLPFRIAVCPCFFSLHFSFLLCVWEIPVPYKYKIIKCCIDTLSYEIRYILLSHDVREKLKISSYDV